MKIFPIIKKITEVISGVNNFIHSASVGFNISTINTGDNNKPEIDTAFVLTTTDPTTVVGQNFAFDVGILNSGTAKNEEVNTAFFLSPVLQQTSGFGPPPDTNQIPAFELVRVQFDLTHRSGPSTATNTGTNAWTNPNNATGSHNGINATSVGNLTAARTFILELQYADQSTEHSQLTISQVNLHFYVEQAGTALNNGDLRLRRDVGDGSGYVTLVTIAGNENDLVTPRTFDITSSINGDWTRVDALKVAVEHRTDIGETLITGAIDSVELEVIAATTMTL